ncbi:hypothetical protein C8Q76DRAFT_803131 [Earliella scabrosa]|nr:hypothetical protein C8Q76DRAFT_803131 [Earliella scabrosa]
MSAEAPGNHADRPPPSKRAKGNAKSAASARTGTAPKSKLTTLSHLPDMPVDILFEIFSNLAPKDLLALARTTKPLRQLLLDRRSTTVWKAARERTFPGSPECPADASEPFWANLLFGDTFCETCGAKNIRRVFFELRRRICAACIKKHGIKPSQFEKSFPDYDKSVLELIPFGVGGGGARTRHYWREDVLAMGEQLSQLRDGIDRQDPGAALAMQHFKEAQMSRVEARFEDAARCYEAVRAKDKRVEDLKKARLDEIHSRFIELGHEECDVKWVCRKLALKAAPLTEKAWQVIRKQLEPVMPMRKEIRIEAAHRHVREPRRKIIDRLYNRHYFFIKPLDICTIPELRQVYGFPDFLAVVNSDDTRDVGPEDFTEAMKKLPPTIKEWQAHVEATMVAMIPQFDPNSERTDPFGTPRIAPEPASLELAVFVTSCSHEEHMPEGEVWVRRRERGFYINDVPIGRREVFSHLLHDSDLSGKPPCEPAFDRVRFSAVGSAAAALLLKLLGLDEKTTTVLEMDQKADAWFVCETCYPFKHDDGRKYRAVLNWRQFINHCMDQWEADRVHCISHVRPRVRRVTEAELRLVQLVEDSAKDDLRLAEFLCNHCVNFLYKPRDIMARHLRERHNVTQATQDRDYFRIPHIRGVRCDPWFFVSDDDQELQILTECAKLVLPPGMDRVAAWMGNPTGYTDGVKCSFPIIVRSH